MLDQSPRESEARSWVYVGIGVLVIYATIPVARWLREIVDAGVGRQVFLYLAAVLIVLVAGLAWRNLRRRNLPINAYLWMLGILLLFAWNTYRLRAIPEEAIHLAEYGALGVLVYRALLHRMRDRGIFLAASLLVGIVGLIDEYIQWIVPSRHFDWRDVYTNFIAAVLGQLFIWLGLRPGLIVGWPSRRSWSHLCNIAAAVVILLALGLQNTPPRVAWYAAQHPSLHFLLDSGNMIAEYGNRFEDPDIGLFRSRFSADELDRLDDERGDDVAKILDRYIRGEGYRKFLSTHSVIRDPYAHEAGVHLFRREYYIDRAREGGEKTGEHYHIAYRENQILQKYFTQAIGRSRHAWSDAVEAEVNWVADRIPDYESPVSAGIITRFNANQILVISFVAISCLVVAGFRLRSGPNRKADRSDYDK